MQEWKDTNYSSFQKKENERKKVSPVSNSKFNRTYSIKFQGLGKVCLALFATLWSLSSLPGLWVLPDESGFFFMKGSICLELSGFINLSPASRILRLPQPFVICPLFVTFGPSQWHFCWYYVFRNLVDLLCMSRGFTPLDNRLLHRSFLDNFNLIFGFH